jgi:hypothetical protein
VTVTLFDGEVNVHFSQIYVESVARASGLDTAEAFAGQVNGLCGAASAGALFLVTGIATGPAEFTLELHDVEPPGSDDWPEVVEASFTPASSNVILVQWGGERHWSLDLEPVAYRVRYSSGDRYLLQFWPAPAAPDRVVRQTGAAAAKRHRYARELPPPPTAEAAHLVEEQARHALEVLARQREKRAGEAR